MTFIHNWWRTKKNIQFDLTMIPLQSSILIHLFLLHNLNLIVPIMMSVRWFSISDRYRLQGTCYSFTEIYKTDRRGEEESSEHKTGYELRED